MTRSRGTELRAWAVLAAAWCLLSLGMAAVGVPSPWLLSGVAVGAVWSLWLRRELTMPKWLNALGMGIIGVEAGAQVTPEVIHQVASAPLLILGSVLGTLALTLLCGLLLQLSPQVSLSTGVFASIAGGASGITAMAKELHADSGIVVAVQYLRVLVITVTVPAVALLSGAQLGSAGAASRNGSIWLALGFTVVALGVGLALARVTKMPAGKILLPLGMAALITVNGWLPVAQVPLPVSVFGMGVIGLSVGLEMTRRNLQTIGRILPLAVASLVLSLVGSALIGLLFSRLAGVPFFTGYLATTPGGLPVVAAFVASSGQDVGLVMTCHVLRLIFALLIAAGVESILSRRATG